MGALNKEVLGILCTVFEAYSAVLFLPEENGRRFYLAASFSLGDSIPAELSVSPGEGLVGWILTNQKQLLVTPFEHGMGALCYYPAGEAGIKSFMGFPLPTGGAVCVDSKRQYSFSEKDCKILQLFANLLSRLQRVGGSEVGGDIPRYFTELSLIQDLRIRHSGWSAYLRDYLDIMDRTTGFDYCVFASGIEGEDYLVIEGESAPLFLNGGKPRRIPLSSGLVSWVFSNAQPVFVEDGLADPAAIFGPLQEMPAFQCVVCMPVIVNRNVRAVLCMASEQPRPLEGDLRAFIRQALDCLTLHLENIYLKDRLKRILPRARLEREGTPVYNPDRVPPKNDRQDAP